MTMPRPLLATADTPISKVPDTVIPAPTGLVERRGDQSVILHWNPGIVAHLAGYYVYRGLASAGPFERLTPELLRSHHFVDVSVENNITYFYQVRTVDHAGRESEGSTTLSVTPQELDDDAFLDLVQRTAFDYFWYEANSANGLIRDRSTETSPCNIAAVGFGLSALIVGIERGWISREAGRDRVLTTLQFFWQSPQGPEPEATGYKGLYYHFLDMQSGQRTWTAELSTVDTALLMAGILHARQYFTQDSPEETTIRSLADTLYRRVDWAWMQVRLQKINHGWTPEEGFLPYDWGGYNEAMLLYLLALGSPTFPVSPTAWQAWTHSYSWQTHYGYDFVTFPPLFGHQYPHVWVDFRGLQDPYMREKNSDYFENSRRATLANRAYTMDNPQGWSDYGKERLWGLSASDIPMGYRARGAPPPYQDDGTITPTAAAGSFAFTPQESLAALRYMYHTYRTRLWGHYGFKDALNPSQDWVSSDYLGVDQGPIVLMIENHRSGSIWEVFMRNSAIRNGLKAAGFTPRQDVSTHSTILPPTRHD